MTLELKNFDPTIISRLSKGVKHFLTCQVFELMLDHNCDPDPDINPDSELNSTLAPNPDSVRATNLDSDLNINLNPDPDPDPESVSDLESDLELEPEPVQYPNLNLELNPEIQI